LSAGPLRGSYSDRAAPDAVVTFCASAESVDIPNSPPANMRGLSCADADQLIAHTARVNADVRVNAFKAFRTA
jgi:hypothetical protein